MNPYLSSGLGEGFSPWCLSCNDVVDCKTEIFFLKDFMFDFQAFYGGAGVLSGFLKLPSFIPFTCYNFCFPFLKTGKLPVFPQQTGRTASLFQNNIRNWAEGRQDSQMFCSKAVPDCSHKLGVFVMLWDFLLSHLRTLVSGSCVTDVSHVP